MYSNAFQDFNLKTVITGGVTVYCLGLHHQGIFRISGSQKDINDFRNQFERGNT